MNESYQIVYRGGTAAIEEKKSRFIAHVEPVSSEEEAVSYISAMKKQYWDARHNCYAFTVGTKQPITRCSDDGEPSGTAGRPILEVLLGAKIHNCVIVVTRYFGGTLLGTGGLVRAYTQAAKEGLSASTVLTRQEGHLYTVTTDYSDSGKLSYLTASEQIPVKDTRYAQAVETDLVMSQAQADTFLKLLTEATSARAQVEKKEALSFASDGGHLILL